MSSSSRHRPHQRQGSTLAQLLLLGGLLAFVGGAWAVDRYIGVHGALGVLAATPLVLIPSLLWLVYFYLQDIHEPEPTHLVFGMFLLGALVAGPLALWIVEDLFQVATWGGVGRFSTGELCASFLVVAPAQELLKYLVVRYTIYLHPEFNEPMDGIVYMSAVGIGFATAWNFHQLTRASQVQLSVGAIDVVVTTLAHACFSGVVGYALGVAKFSPGGGRARILTLGLGAAMLLNGAFVLVEDLVTRRGLDYLPWAGLVGTAGFAAAVFALLSVLVRRHLASSPHAPSDLEVTS